MLPVLLIMVEKWKGPFVDDTALNGITLFCTYPNSRVVQKSITSTVGSFGSWGNVYWCDSGYVEKFSLRVEPEGKIDNTAANNFKVTCSDGSVKEGDGQSWGHYGPESSECEQGVVGIKTKVQDSKGLWEDDFGLTDVILQCLDTN